MASVKRPDKRPARQRYKIEGKREKNKARRIAKQARKEKKKAEKLKKLKNHIFEKTLESKE
jgi:hypothetical protein